MRQPIAGAAEGSRIGALAREVAGPLTGLVLTYLLCALTPWGRYLESLASDGRMSTGWSVRRADLVLLQTISTAGVLLALGVLVLVGVIRGRWQLALRNTVAVLGALLSAELLKKVLPSESSMTGDWRWPPPNSFPSGHAVIMTAICVAVLSVSSNHWRRLLVGPLVAATAITTTATVTVGWHRPGDVIGSFFLVIAWHRASMLGRAPENRLRTLVPRPGGGLRDRSAVRLPAGAAILWWAGACLLVLGAAGEGIRSDPLLGQRASLAYLAALVVLLSGAVVTVAGSESGNRTGLAN